MNRRTWIGSVVAGIGAAFMPWKVKAAPAVEWRSRAQFLDDVKSGQAVGRNYDLGAGLCHVRGRAVITNCRIRHSGCGLNLVLESGSLFSCNIVERKP